MTRFEEDTLVSALELIALIGEGSGTANSLPHIAKIAREALKRIGIAEKRPEHDKTLSIER
jgi:hypothetical protein